MAAKVRRVEADVHTTRVVRVNARVKPTVNVRVQPVKRTFSRCDLPEGDFLMTYYYVVDASGNYVPEDIDRATHYERVIFDRDGNTIGSTMGRLSDEIRW
ncbi:MAG: hypothetical protein E7554_09595 [Ruminococcaceae bacterium]|nr:hypothetical protein [Oscillospiraceae bacterium]